MTIAVLYDIFNAMTIAVLHEIVLERLARLLHALQPQPGRHNVYCLWCMICHVCSKFVVLSQSLILLSLSFSLPLSSRSVDKHCEMLCFVYDGGLATTWLNASPSGLQEAVLD